MQLLNAELAKQIVGGRLDNNPFVQGLLVQCLDRLEKAERGVVSMRGRAAASTDAKSTLLQNAALTLAIAGGNKHLAVELGQKMTPTKVKLEELERLGLPNPAMALLDCNIEQFRTNLKLVDQRHGRDEKMSPRRLILGFDATYLLRTVSQFRMNNEVGLIGGPWSPGQEELCFVNIESMRKDMERAPVMYEFLAWDPCGKHRGALSIASMPMNLKAPKSSSAKTQTHAANWESWLHDVGITIGPLKLRYIIVHQDTANQCVNVSKNIYLNHM